MFLPICYMFINNIIGCWFGDVNSESRDLKVWVPKITESDLRGVDCQLRVKDLCRKLVELLFSDEECKNGNATEARTPGVTLLDSHRFVIVYV